MKHEPIEEEKLFETSVELVDLRFRLMHGESAQYLSLHLKKVFCVFRESNRSNCADGLS